MRRKKIPSKKLSLKLIAGQSLDKIEEYALKSNTIRKIGAMIYYSSAYKYITKKISEFRDLKLFFYSYNFLPPIYIT